jgi:large subunit ribosomal protein L4
VQLDVVNQDNEKVGSIDVRDEVFGGRVRTDLIWASVVRANAAERRGTHATKNRARVGEIRNPLWRKGGTVFGPQPRSYAYALPRKVERGALGAALAQKLREGRVTVVEQLAAAEPKTKLAAQMLARLGAERGALLVDVAVDEGLARSVRNLPGVEIVSSRRLAAREVMRAPRLVITRGALERLQEALGTPR